MAVKMLIRDCVAHLLYWRRGKTIMREDEQEGGKFSDLYPVL